MRQRIDKNFQKRFGGRITVSFADRPLPPTERKAQNETLCSAIAEVMAGILKREPTDAELLGVEDISAKKHRRKK
ncbi:MAG: hypothetical protein HZB82_09235 [Deltaproteobacteria bacterium]|nr:hypothetical protein [Deltaproteobacteria bacterium]